MRARCTACGYDSGEKATLDDVAMELEQKGGRLIGATVCPACHKTGTLVVEGSKKGK